MATTPMTYAEYSLSNKKAALTHEIAEAEEQVRYYTEKKACCTDHIVGISHPATLLEAWKMNLRLKRQQLAALG